MLNFECSVFPNNKRYIKCGENRKFLVPMNSINFIKIFRNFKMSKINKIVEW